MNILPNNGADKSCVPIGFKLFPFVSQKLSQSRRESRFPAKALLGLDSVPRGIALGQKIFSQPINDSVAFLKTIMSSQEFIQLIRNTTIPIEIRNERLKEMLLHCLVAKNERTSLFIDKETMAKCSRTAANATLDDSGQVEANTCGVYGSQRANHGSTLVGIATHEFEHDDMDSIAWDDSNGIDSRDQMAVEEFTCDASALDLLCFLSDGSTTQFNQWFREYCDDVTNQPALYEAEINGKRVKAPNEGAMLKASREYRVAEDCHPAARALLVDLFSGFMSNGIEPHIFCPLIYSASRQVINRYKEGHVPKQEIFSSFIEEVTQELQEPLKALDLEIQYLKPNIVSFDTNMEKYQSQFKLSEDETEQLLKARFPEASNEDITQLIKAFYLKKLDNKQNQSNSIIVKLLPIPKIEITRKWKT